MSTGVLQEVERLVAGSIDADEALRSVVSLLASEPGIVWAGIAFFEEGRLTLGPEAGEPEEQRRTRTSVVYEDVAVAELWADGPSDPALLKSVADLIAAHCLVGWDTGGVPWSDGAR